ncbi:MAG: hypothetical protein ACRDKI_03835 [Solirubrobacterales bacterium]
MTYRRFFTLLAIAACTMLMAASTASAADVVNGTFDDGLTGWTTEVGDAGFWQANADCNGTGACYSSATSSGDSAGVMYQDVQLQAGHLIELSLSLKAITQGAAVPWTSNTPPELLHGGGTSITTQEARIDVMKPSADPWSIDPADILGTVFQTENGTSTTYDWQNKTFDLTPWAGQTVRLRAGWTMGNWYLDFAVDNVKVTEVLPVPVISNPKLTTHRFEAARKGSTILSAARSYGTTLTYDLSKPATVGLKLEKYSAKRTWLPVAGSASLAGVAGANTAKLSARLSAKRPLSPGKYKLLLTPVDSAGNVGAPTEVVVRVLTPR